MKLSEYKNNEQQNQETKEQTTTQNKSAEELFNTYKDMDESQLMQTLFNEVSKQKQQGTFDYQKLQETLSQVMPFLSDDQKNNLLTILQKLK